MEQISSARRKPAIIVAALALVAALVGTAVAGDPVANTSALTEKKVKKLIRKEVKKQIANAVGPQGPAGAPGEAATNLFAYVRDTGPAEAAVVGYGSGVTEVSDSGASSGSYILTFNRSVQNCVAQANIGVGDPAGAGASFGSASHTSLDLAVGGTNQLLVSTFNTQSGTFVDSSFLISVFC